MGYSRRYLAIRNHQVEPGLLNSIKNMGSVTTTTTTAATSIGGGTLTLASIANISVGELIQSGTLIPAGVSVAAMNKGAKKVAMSSVAINNIGSGATINFTLPSFTGFNLNSDTTTVSPTQTAVHITLSSKAGPRANMNLSAASLLSLGQIVADDFANTNGTPAILQSAASLNHQVRIELLVTA
jgi:hypothetical protein